MTPNFYLAVMGIFSLIILIASITTNFLKAKREISVGMQQGMTRIQMQEFEKKISTFLLENNIKPGSDISVIGDVLNLNSDKPTTRRKEEQREGTVALARKCGQIISKNKNSASSDSCEAERKQSVPKQAYLPAGQKEELVVFSGNGLSPIRKSDDLEPEDEKATITLALPAGAQAEQEIDYIAIALLMPLEDVFAYLSNNSFLTAPTRKKVGLIRKLCRIYGVDSMTVVQRIQEVYALKD